MGVKNFRKKDVVLTSNNVISVQEVGIGFDVILRRRRLKGLSGFDLLFDLDLEL